MKEKPLGRLTSSDLSGGLHDKRAYFQKETFSSVRKPWSSKDAFLRYLSLTKYPLYTHKGPTNTLEGELDMNMKTQDKQTYHATQTEC